MDLLRYSGIISSPLIAILVLVLATNLNGYSFSKNTLSQSILFIKDIQKLILYYSIFTLKGVFDLIFSLFLLFRSGLEISSPIGLILLAYPIIFVIGGYVTERGSTVLHNKIIYFSGVLWFVGNLLLSLYLKDNLLTYGIILVFIIISSISYIYHKRGKLTYNIQAFCMTLIWIWTLLLTILI